MTNGIGRLFFMWLSRNCHKAQIKAHGHIGVWAFLGAWLERADAPSKAAHKEYRPTVADEAAYLRKKGYM